MTFGEHPKRMTVLDAYIEPHW